MMLIVDFYCHQAGLVIEVDGDVHDLQREEDERREKALSTLGLRVVRFRNDEVVRGLSAVVGKIREAIQFVDLIIQSHSQARKVGLTEEDIRSAVKKARKR